MTEHHFIATPKDGPAVLLTITGVDDPKQAQARAESTGYTVSGGPEKDYSAAKEKVKAAAPKQPAGPPSVDPVAVLGNTPAAQPTPVKQA